MDEIASSMILLKDLKTIMAVYDQYGPYDIWCCN